MIGALKCCGARVLRNVPASSSALESSGGGVFSSFGECNGFNWSQKRFLRGQTSSPGGGESEKNKKMKCEMENDENENILPNLDELGSNPPIPDNQSLSEQNTNRKHCISVRGLQSHLIATLPKSDKLEQALIAEISKIIVESGPEAIRIKNRKDEDLIREWIGIQNELCTVKHDRIEDDKRKLQIAGQQVLRDMARLTKSINLDELDQAIEGALCSQAKVDYGQQKSNHDT